MERWQRLAERLDAGHEMPRGVRMSEIEAREDLLLCLVLRVIADRSPCTKPSLFAQVLPGDFAAPDSTTRGLVDNALQRLEFLQFIQRSQDRLSITDAGNQFLGGFPLDALGPQNSTLVSSFRSLMARSAVTSSQWLNGIWQGCVTRSCSIEQYVRAHLSRRRNSASRLWNSKIAPIFSGEDIALAPILGGAAEVFHMRAGVFAASLRSCQNQLRAQLKEPVVFNGLLSKSKLVSLGPLKIVSSVFLALAASIIAFITFVSSEHGKETKGAALVSATSIANEETSVLAAKLKAIRKAIRERVSALAVADDWQKQRYDALKAYYSASTAPLLWVNADGLTAHAKSVMDEIARADEYGLRAKDYDLPTLRDHLSVDSQRADQLADVEIGLSLSVLHYTHDARGGRIKPSRLTAYLDPEVYLPDPANVLNSISRQDDPAAYIRGFHPSHPQFEALRKKLLELRSSDATDNKKPAVQIPEGPLLKLGIEHEQVALLRARLELPLGQHERIFDKTVAEAVEQFQIEHHATADGMVGSGTRQLLNAPHLRHGGNAITIKSIIINMERWRWLPRDLGKFYVTVNIPEFTLRVVKNTETIHNARVVVGKPNNQTPVFSNAMDTVVFGPFWNVPNSIKVEELRPHLRQKAWFFGGGGWDTSVLRRHNLRVKYRGREVDPGTLDWNRIDIRSLHIYQRPGPDNVLGKVKFLFPNKHSVYMHDTIEKELFTKDVRAESHGCVRVQDPGKLASIILEHDQGWSPTRTVSEMENGYDQRVTLREPVPVHITYFTTNVNLDGSISKFQDLYGHDARMASALFGNIHGFRHPIRASKRPSNDLPPSKQETWGDVSPADIVDNIVKILEN
jgi:murein L,D-transpeptidase YcbB/YkuD